MATIVFTLAAYLIGSLSFAVIVSRMFGLPDPHSYGSGNPGATNVLRTGKRLAAALTLVGDTGKGALAVILARYFAADYGVDMIGIALVAVAVFLGHLYPVFFRFKGGKGVATALGILCAINLGSARRHSQAGRDHVVLPHRVAGVDHRRRICRSTRVGCWHGRPLFPAVLAIAAPDLPAQGKTSGACSGQENRIGAKKEGAAGTLRPLTLGPALRSSGVEKHPADF